MRESVFWAKLRTKLLAYKGKLHVQRIETGMSSRGIPDLLIQCVGADRPVFIELKVHPNKPSALQSHWRKTAIVCGTDTLLAILRGQDIEILFPDDSLKVSSICNFWQDIIKYMETSTNGHFKDSTRVQRRPRRNRSAQ